MKMFTVITLTFEFFIYAYTEVYIFFIIKCKLIIKANSSHFAT